VHAPSEAAHHILADRPSSGNMVNIDEIPRFIAIETAAKCKSEVLNDNGHMAITDHRGTTDAETSHCNAGCMYQENLC